MRSLILTLARRQVSQGLRRKHVQKDLKQASGVDDLIRLVAHIICEINQDLGV